MLSVILRILEELAGQVQAQGGRIVLADACSYFGDPSETSDALKQLSNQRQIGYLPLGDRLRVANQRGRPTRWAHDGHCNEAGNQVFAAALAEWISENVPR